MTGDSVPYSDEKARVAWLASTFRDRNGPSPAVPGVTVLAGASSGDDCAVVDWRTSQHLVVGMDYVRGPKFRLFELGFLSYRDIARFLVTANVSDIAAMGARPVGFLAVVRYPKGLSDPEFEEIMHGVGDACRHYGCALLGGDTGSAERLILAGTALGVAGPAGALLRSSAHPGDVFAVTGSVGGAGAAVLAADAGVQEHLPDAVWADLLSCWTRYVAQPGAGAVLGQAGRVACQDVSDGLLTTAREIAAASNVGIVLEPASIPLHPGVRPVADELGVDPVSLGISASTDFCLAFTCDPTSLHAISDELGRRNMQVTPVGRVEPGEGVWFEEAGGALVRPEGVEWRHQGDGLAEVVLTGLRSRPAAALAGVRP